MKPDEVILNLSSYTLSEAEKNILVLGLNYTFATSDVSDINFLASLEIASRRLKQNINNPDDWSEVKRVFMSSLNDTANIETHKRNDKRSCAILRKLGKNDDLYISKPDKGNGIVILNRSDYVSWMSF